MKGRCAMSGLLEGLRVLALDQVVAGPYGSMILADNGAEVIKVERPGRGEVGRELFQVPVGPEGKPISVVLFRLNRNKRGITLNLKDERGRQLFRELVRISDVVWENLEPGTLQGVGLGYEELRPVNPGLIYVSISGFGQPGRHGGPYWRRPAYDMVVQAMAGLMYLPGQPQDPPIWLGTQLADMYPSLMAVAALLMALYRRERTGEGRHLDIAMYDAAVALLERYVAIHSLTGRSVVRQEENSNQVGVVQARDGYLVVGVVSQEAWPRLCRVLDRPDLVNAPRFSQAQARLRNKGEIRVLVEAWARDRTRQAVVDALVAESIPVGTVQTLEEVLECPHLAARGMWEEVEVPWAGSFRLVGNPIKASGVEPQPATPPPALGQHTEEVLTSLLGLSPGEVRELRAQGVV